MNNILSLLFFFSELLLWRFRGRREKMEIELKKTSGQLTELLFCPENIYIQYFYYINNVCIIDEYFNTLYFNK